MWLKRLRKLLFTTLLLALSLFAGLAALVYVYHEQIIALFVQQANQQLNTPVQTEHIGISFWQDFPHVAITLDGVQVQESIPFSEAPLLRARRLAFSFRLWDVLNGKYRIRNLHLEDARVNMRISRSGVSNFKIFRDSKEVSADTSALQFDLENIQLKNVAFTYTDARQKQDIRLLADKIQAGLTVEGDRYAIKTSGTLQSEGILLGEDLYFKGLPLEITSQFAYDHQAQGLFFTSANLIFPEGSLQLSGSWTWPNQQVLDLQLEAHDLGLNILQQALPERYTNTIKSYQSSGQLQAKGSIQGTLSAEENPAVRLSFSLKNGSLLYPANGERLQGISLRGNFSNGSRSQLSESRLQLEHFSAQLDGKTLEGSLQLTNFKDYHLALETRGEIRFPALLRFYPIKDLHDAQGNLKAELRFSGRLADLKQASTLPRLQLSGDVHLEQLGFRWKNQPYAFQGLQGTLSFNRRDIALSNLQGHAGESHFLLNGLFKNVLAYLLLENQPLTVEADLQSNALNLDELLADAGVAAKEVGNGPERYYSFDINPALQLDFNCQVEQLRFDRFRARKVAGRLRVNGGVAQIERVSLQAAGGSMRLSGQVDARMQNLLKVNAQAHFDQIFIDSAFYIFRNFSQDFLMDRHLNGRLTADVESRMIFDKKLRFAYDKLQATANVQVNNGRLRDFAPLQDLSRFIHEDKLADVSFSELNSQVEIRNKTVFLPETRIQTDISTLTLSGTHTFDQHIHYRLKLPVRTLFTGKRREVPQASAQQSQQGLHLLLRVVGTTDNYHISYDTEAVRAKLANDLKEEKKELREAFQTKGETKKKALELEEEEYFDW